jgi:Ran GTPase-activating protein (RanGAP) involved in mRNA processing and transport
VLDLRNNTIGAAGAAALARALGIGGDGSFFGCSSSSLRLLNLQSNDIGARAGLLTNALQTALSRNSTLRSLRLGNNDMSAVGVLAFAQALGANRSLTHLDLDGMKPLPLQLQLQRQPGNHSRSSSQ